MKTNMIDKHRWGVILAGGDGVRLRSLTQLLSGDDRPKQFCRLLGGKTLLAQTRQRVARTIAENRTLFVLTNRHKPYYSQELADVSPVRMVEQPSNQGTLSAILCSLMRVARMDPNAVVAFFPSDHYYHDEPRFTDAVAAAFKAAEGSDQSVTLLGADAKYPEVEFGWIEPDATASNSLQELGPYPIMRVRRFWEKPSRQIAQDLVERGCLWNTFVMVGRVNAFLAMIQTAVPGLYQDFESILTLRSLGLETSTLRTIYNRLTSADFSRRVLSLSTDRLNVLRLGDSGWSDLGDAPRVLSLLSQIGVSNGDGMQGDPAAQSAFATSCA